MIKKYRAVSRKWKKGGGIDKSRFCHTPLKHIHIHTPCNRDYLKDNPHSQPWWAVPLRQWQDSEEAPRGCPIHLLFQCMKPCQGVPAPLPPLSLAKPPGHLSQPSPITTSVPCASWGLSSGHYSLAAPRTTPVYTSYLQLITWGTSPKNKIGNYSSRFSGVQLCLCSWYKLNLVMLYNCFNFAFTILKALLLIGNCLFNLVFSKYCYCFFPL